jgi:hypothetical protein
MNNDALPFRVYGIRFLNADLHKEQDDRVLAKDLRVGPSGILEFTRIWPDAPEAENKGMYSGEWLAEEIDREDFEEWQREAKEHNRQHHHEDEGEDDA